MTHRRNTLLLAALAAGAGAIPAAALAAGTTSHANTFDTKTVGCGIAIASVPRGQLLCSARGVPRPKGRGVGDPFVTLASSGKPKLVLISQDSYASGNPASLMSGDTWSRGGFTCTIGSSSVTCKNGSGHGFTIGNGHYKAF